VATKRGLHESRVDERPGWSMWFVSVAEFVKRGGADGQLWLVTPSGQFSYRTAITPGWSQTA
jgi:hypothetical protein